MSHSCTDDDNFRNYHVEEKRQGRFEERVMDSELARAMSLFVPFQSHPHHLYYRDFSKCPSCLLRFYT